jgi:hypothetical protein
MSRNEQLPIPQDTSDGDEAITPQDIKALNLVQSVLSYMAEHKLSNYSEAFRRMTAGTPQNAEALSRNYYNALQRPYVKMRVIERLRMRDVAWLEMLGLYLGPALQHAYAIASGQQGYPRDAVAAQRFLYEVFKDLRSTVEEEDALALESPATKFMEEFWANKATYRAKRSRKKGNVRVEEEIAVEFPTETHE